MIPVLIILMFVYAAGGYVIERQDREHRKEVMKRVRHIYDEDKRQDTENIAKVYNEVILKEIWK